MKSIPNFWSTQKSLQKTCLLFDPIPNLTKKIPNYLYRGKPTPYRWQWGYQKGIKNLKLLNNPKTQHLKNKLELAKINPLKTLIKVHRKLIAVEELAVLILERGTLQMISDTKLKYLKSVRKLTFRAKNLKETSKSGNQVQALNNENNKIMPHSKEKIQVEWLQTQMTNLSLPNNTSPKQRRTNRYLWS